MVITRTTASQASTGYQPMERFCCSLYKWVQAFNAFLDVWDPLPFATFFPLSCLMEFNQVWPKMRSMAESEHSTISGVCSEVEKGSKPSNMSAGSGMIHSKYANN